MAKKTDLRAQRANTVINARSKGQEQALDRALRTVESKLKAGLPPATLPA